MHDLPQRLAVGRTLIHLVANAELSLGLGHISLQSMHIHLVSIEIGVVALAVGIVHAEGGFLRQYLHAVGHQTCLVQRRLAVEQNIVA